MSFPAADLLEAIPADARRILVIGEELLRHQEGWQARNPLTVIEAATGPLTGHIPKDTGPTADAAILSVDELGDSAAAAVKRTAACLEVGGTIALFGKTHRSVAAIQRLGAMLTADGMVLDRVIGGQSPGGHGIARFLRPAGSLPQLRVMAHQVAANSGPLSGSVVRVRLAEPFEQLQSLPGVRCTIFADGQPLPATDANAANVLVVQRKLFPKPELYLQPAYALNYIVVAEFDDLIMDEQIFTAARYKENMAGFHAIQVSTQALAEQMRQYHPEVGVFGNHLPRIRPAPTKASAPIQIFLAAYARQAACREIMHTYREILAGYGDSVVTVVVGDRAFFDALQPLNSRFLPLLAYSDYVQELGRSHVAVLPLTDNQFDRCKTDLKFIECAEAGTAVLASHVVYGETVRTGETGYVYRNQEEFRWQLRRLLDEASTRDQLAANAHRYVQEHRALANQVRRQYDWFLSLAERRAELAQGIKDRLRLL